MRTFQQEIQGCGHLGDRGGHSIQFLRDAEVLEISSGTRVSRVRRT